MRRRETPREARQRRYCRFTLGLPPEIVYHHVGWGVATLTALSVVLLAIVAWQLGQLATIAPPLFSGSLLAALTPTVLMIRRRYRHVVAGLFALVTLLCLLAAAVNRYGAPAPVTLVVGPTPSAIADAVTPR